jgi:hypothetical protein
VAPAADVLILLGSAALLAVLSGYTQDWPRVLGGSAVPIGVPLPVLAAFNARRKELQIRDRGRASRARIRFAHVFGASRIEAIRRVACVFGGLYTSLFLAQVVHWITGRTRADD